MTSRLLARVAVFAVLGAVGLNLGFQTVGIASGRPFEGEDVFVGTVDEDALVIADLRARLRAERRRSRALARSSRHLRVQVRQLGREVRRRWDYPTLIRIAAVTYGVSEPTLQRKARCESVNFTDFYNEASKASNVFQFLPSTWRTTPYARFSIFNPFAAVLAGAWMHREGRGGEWECR